MTIRALQSAVAVLTLVLFSSVASAQPKQKIAILGLEAVVGANGRIDPADTAFAKDLSRELRARANNSTTFVLTKDQRELVDEKLMNNCGAEHAQCMSPIGASMGADVLLFGRVANAKNGGYRVTLTLVDVRKRQPIGSDPNALIASADTRNPGLANWVREHYKKLTGESSEGQLLITVVGATTGRVLVNGETRETLKSGQATLSLAEGRYRIQVEADGFKLWEQDGVTITGDRPTELKPDLVKSKPIDTAIVPNKGAGDSTTGTADLISREGTVSSKSTRTPWKIAAAVGLGGAVVGGGLMVWSYTQMSGFDGAAVTGGATFTGGKATVTQDDCGKGSFSGGNAKDLNNKFNAACDGKDRMKWLAPTTVGLAAIGAGALIYVMVSKDAEERPTTTGRRAKKKTFVVTPVITPGGTGATMRFDW